MDRMVERIEIATIASVCIERKSSVEDPSKVKNTVCLIESVKYSFLIVEISNPFEFFWDT